MTVPCEIRPTNPPVSIQALDEPLMANVFSFLGKPDDHDILADLLNQNVEFEQRPSDYDVPLQFSFHLFSPREACQVFSPLTEVNKSWLRICNQNMKHFVGLLHVDMGRNYIRRKWRYERTPGQAWACKHKLYLGSIHFSANEWDTPIVTGLLQNMDTTRLKCVVIGITGTIDDEGEVLGARGDLAELLLAERSSIVDLTVVIDKWTDAGYCRELIAGLPSLRRLGLLYCWSGGFPLNEIRHYDHTSGIPYLQYLERLDISGIVIEWRAWFRFHHNPCASSIYH